MSNAHYFDGASARLHLVEVASGDGHLTIDGGAIHQRCPLDQVRLAEPFLNYPVVLQGNLAPALKQSIRDAFLNMKDKEVLKAFRVEAFASTTDAAYDVLRDTASVLKLDLGSMK